MVISSNLYGQTSWIFYHMIPKNTVQDLMVILLKNVFLFLGWTQQKQ